MDGSTTETGPMPKLHEHVVELGAERVWTSVGVPAAHPEDGPAPPLLFIMGYGGNLELWRPLRRALGSYYTIAFDLPGMGRSAPPRRLMRAPAVATMITQLLDTLDCRKVDVLGISMGGGLAQQLAHQAPERVRRLILCSTSAGTIMVPGLPWDLLPLLRPSTSLRALGAAASSRTSSSQDEAPVPRDAARHDDMMRLGTHAPSKRGQLAQLYGLAGWTSLPWIRGLPQRTLVVAGSRDRIVPPVNSRLLSGLIPDARLQMIDDAGHLFILSHAPQAATLVRDFLA